MGIFDLFKKKPKGYDKKHVKSVFDDNPKAFHAAQRMFNAKHGTLGGKSPFRIGPTGGMHRPNRLAVLWEGFTELFKKERKGEKKKRRQQVKKYRQEFWDYFREAEILEKKTDVMERIYGQSHLGCQKARCWLRNLMISCIHHAGRPAKPSNPDNPTHARFRRYTLGLPPRNDAARRKNPYRTLCVIAGSDDQHADKITLIVGKKGHGGGGPDQLCDYHVLTVLALQMNDGETVDEQYRWTKPKAARTDKHSFLAKSRDYAKGLKGFGLPLLTPRKYLVRPLACHLPNDISGIVAVYPDLQWDVQLNINLPEIVTGSVFATLYEQGNFGGKFGKWEGLNVGIEAYGNATDIIGSVGVGGHFIKTFNGKKRDVARKTLRWIDRIFTGFQVVLALVKLILDLIAVIGASAAPEHKDSATSKDNAKISFWGLAAKVEFPKVEIGYQACLEEIERSWKVGAVWKWWIKFDPLLGGGFEANVTEFAITAITTAAEAPPWVGWLINRLRAATIGSAKAGLGVEWELCGLTLSLTIIKLSFTAGFEKPKADDPTVRMLFDEDLVNVPLFDFDLAFVPAKGKAGLKIGIPKVTNGVALDVGAKLGLRSTAARFTWESYLKEEPPASGEKRPWVTVGLRLGGLYLYAGFWMSLGSVNGVFWHKDTQGETRLDSKLDDWKKKMDRKAFQNWFRKKENMKKDWKDWCKEYKGVWSTLKKSQAPSKGMKKDDWAGSLALPLMVKLVPPINLTWSGAAWKWMTHAGTSTMYPEWS